MTEVLPLAGVRVVELAQGVPGPYCGWLLACAGADVLKVEPSEGDYLRRLEPVTPDGSAAFAAINSGKRSAAFDIRSEAGRTRIAPLITEADVVILDESATDIRDWLQSHLGAGTLVASVPALVDGVPASELELQAASGLSRYLGSLAEPPRRLGADLGGVISGAFLFQGVLAALFERESSGLGQEIEVTGVGGLAALASVMIAALDDPDVWEGFHCLAAGYSVDYGLQTDSGAISFSAPRRSDEDWQALCAELKADAMATNPLYEHDSGRTPRSKELNRELSAYTKAFQREEVLEVARRHEALAVPVQTYEEVFSHEQVRAIDAVRDTSDGPRLAPPWRINGHRPHPRSGVPVLGTHSTDALVNDGAEGGTSSD